MKILYYCWDEVTSQDLLDTFNELNYSVTIVKYNIFNKICDKEFEDKFNVVLENNSFDCIFSFNYFPTISNCAINYSVPYISWTYDSPNSTLYTKSIYNDCNHIFCFDNDEVVRLQSYGVKNVYHMPLAINALRLSKMLDNKNKKYLYEISFLGTLYNDENNFYDQIGYMPNYYKGYFDAIIASQMNIYGLDLALNMITDNIMQEISKYVNIQLVEELLLNEKDFFINMLRKKVSVKERFEILQMISDKYRLTHFAESTSSLFKNVDFRGYANYTNEMPYIFNSSKINLNISLRSIQSGMPLRCLDVMGAGGFLLSNFQKELAYFFEPNKELVLYDSRSDLMRKIEYYLNHDDEREEIARRGKEKVMKQFDYIKVIQEIFRIVSEVKY